MWQIFASYPLGDGYWTRHTVSDPESGECFDLIERHKIAAGLAVFVCMEGCESDWCSHIRDGATVVTMSRAGEGEGCATVTASSALKPDGSSGSRRSAKRTASPKPKNPRRFKKDRLKLWAAAEANLPEFLKAKDAEIAAWVEEIQRED